jgi:molybdopterin/thiamine biosynthesis adenylyltransferase
MITSFKKEVMRTLLMKTETEEGGTEIITEPQYTRLKGAEWFPLAYKKEVLILGQGGIGSWATLFYSRIGCTIHSYDMDTFEDHNMSGQMVAEDAIGKPKVEAVANVVRSFSPDASIITHNEAYSQDSPTADIVICGFDNMKARKIAFVKWVDYVQNRAPDKSKCFFQDGRLLAETLQIFNIAGNDLEGMKKYYKEHLFDDSEVEEVDCTFKQTSHCAGMIASHMVALFTNWLTKSHNGTFRKIPFLYQHVIPLNLTENA